MDEKDQAFKPFDVTFGEREITFNPPNEGQSAIIARAVRKANRGGRAALDAIALVLDVIDALVVNPEDRDFLEDGLIDTSIELNDFIGVLDGINGGKDEPKPAKTVATRARSGRR
jgi:hypothetical protein